jgi:transposase
VASDIMGVWGRAILAALLAGETDPAVLAELSKGPLRKKRPQLEQGLRGHLHPHQSFVLTELLAQIDSLDETIARFTAQIQATCRREAGEAEVVALLDTIPGLWEATAQVIVSEIGIDMSRFPSAAALAAWAGLAPGNDESAGRKPPWAQQPREMPGCGPSWSSRPRRPPIPNTRLWRRATGVSPLDAGARKRWWRWRTRSS